MYVNYEKEGRKDMFYLTMHSTHFIYGYMVKYLSDRERANLLPPHRLLFLINSKEGNILFNDALSTFYLRLYGIGYMVKNHSDRERANPLPHIGYSFQLAARVLLYASSHRQDNTYHGLCYTSRGALE